MQAAWGNYADHDAGSVAVTLCVTSLTRSVRATLRTRAAHASVSSKASTLELRRSWRRSRQTFEIPLRSPPWAKTRFGWRGWRPRRQRAWHGKSRRNREVVLDERPRLRCVRAVLWCRSSEREIQNTGKRRQHKASNLLPGMSGGEGSTGPTAARARSKTSSVMCKTPSPWAMRF